MFETLFRDDELHEEIDQVVDRLDTLEADITALDTETPSPTATTSVESPANDPNAQYTTLREQIAGLRMAVNQEIQASGGLPQSIFPDEEAVAQRCYEFAQGVEGMFVYAAANDFGRPFAVVPSGKDARFPMRELADALYDRKWEPTHRDLRQFHHDTKRAVTGIHMGLPAVVTEDSVRYDLVAPTRSTDADFLTMREPIGLVEWIVNEPNTENWMVEY